MVVIHYGRLLYQFEIGLRLVPPVRHQDQVPILQLRDQVNQFGSLICRTKLTVVFVLTVAQLAFFAIREEHAWHSNSVIKDLELVEFIADAFTIVVHLTVFEVSFVLCLNYRLFVVIWTAALGHIDVIIAHYDWSKKLEDSFFDLPERHIFIEDENTRLSQWLWRLEYHVARPLLSDHDLDGHQILHIRIFILHIAL